MTLTDAEQDQLREREIASWTRVQSSKDSATGQLHQGIPSGSASDLAQSRLNRLLAAQGRQKKKGVKIAMAPTTQVITRDAQVRVELAQRAAAALNRNAG